MKNINRHAIEELLVKIGDYQVDGFKNLTPDEIKTKEEKGRKSFLTEYDIRSEQMLLEYVDEHYPTHSFLGEETGNLVRDPAVYWIVDPIDGTTNFTVGLPFWGISLAIWQDQDVKHGFIFFPLLKQMFYAGRGRGSFLNGQKIHTSGVGEYSRTQIVATMSETHRFRKLLPVTKHRILGSCIANLMGVATGKFLACFMKAKIWDIAAGVLLVEEAGGVVHSVPDYHELDLTRYDYADPLKIEVHAKANEHLPDFESILIKEP